MYAARDHREKKKTELPVKMDEGSQLCMHLINQMLMVPPFLLLLLIAAGVGGGLEFNFDGSSNDMITLVKEGAWYTGQDPYYSDSAIWLTPNPNQLNFKGDPNQGVVGRIVYKNPIPFPSSFTTSFGFQIITNGSFSDSGSGMAFFISTSEQAPNNSVAGGLGLVYYQKVGPLLTPEFPFFAVEFDTRVSPAYKDVSASHIGIDINSLVSSNVTDTSPNSSSPFYPELFLYSNSTFTAWVDYSNGFIQVWMVKSESHSAGRTATRPPQTCVQLQHDLSNLFNSGQPVYVGFSSTNRPSIISQEGTAIFFWSFSAPDAGSSSNRLLLPLILSAVALLALVGAICAGGFLIRRRRRRRLGSSARSTSIWKDMQKQLSSPASSLPRYSYRELRKAANGFSEKNKVGEGGYSNVYSGTLADGSAVAMKKLKDGLKREPEVVSEIGIISRLRHRNLLQLEGWCYERGEAILVYKYMKNGSLDSYLYGKERGRLESKARIRILEGVAAALEYLHGGLAMGECVMHRDVKAANVLLTEEWEAVLGDFGLARLISEEGKTMTLTVAGTPGYVAPEVVYMGRGTSKADVYSWGVLALEVACGRHAMDATLQERRLLNWVWLLHQNDRLLDALDPSLQKPGQEAIDIAHWRCVLHLALGCCHPSPDSRPSMRQVCHVLHDAILLPLPTNYTSPSTHDWILSDYNVSSSAPTFESDQPAYSIQLADPPALDSMSMERHYFSS